MRGLNVVVWSALLAVCFLFWSAVAGCVLQDPATDPEAVVTPDPPIDSDERPIDSDERPIDSDELPQVFPELVKKALTREDFDLTLMARASREASYLPDQFATVNIRHMPQLADVEGGLPLVMTPTTKPKIGEEFFIFWVTRPIGNYPQSVVDSYDPAKRVPPNHWTLPALDTHRPSYRPDRATALLITLQEPGEPWLIPGGKGAMQQVPPDYILIPTRIEEPARIERHNRPGVQFEFVQNEHGKILLRMVAPQGLGGLQVWCQLLVEDRRVPAGFVTTPMVELNIGSK